MWTLMFAAVAVYAANRAVKPDPVPIVPPNNDELDPKRWAHNGKQPMCYKVGNSVANCVDEPMIHELTPF